MAGRESFARLMNRSCIAVKGLIQLKISWSQRNLLYSGFVRDERVADCNWLSSWICYSNGIDEANSQSIHPKISFLITSFIAANDRKDKTAILQ